MVLLLPPFWIMTECPEARRRSSTAIIPKKVGGVLQMLDREHLDLGMCLTMCLSTCKARATTATQLCQLPHSVVFVRRLHGVLQAAASGSTPCRG